MGLRRMVLGFVTTALAASAAWGGGSAFARALEEAPTMPFGWDYSPARARNGRTRSPGGRAHRRWRIARASGRR